MVRMKIFRKPEIYCVLVLILSLWGMLEFFPKIENVRLVRDTATQESSFPLLMKMEKGERFSVEFDVKSRLSNYDLNIIPDDCAEIVIVNGSMVDLNHIQGNCNFAKGFVLRDSVTAPYKVGDKTHYSFYLINNGGDAGLNVLVKQASFLPVVLYVLIVLSLASLCLLLARRLGLGWGLAIVIFALSYFV